MKGTYRHLAELTVTQGLLGPEGLAEPVEVEPPDKYQLLECIGRGGFGTVYKARDKALDRMVALKFLSDARPADLERFRREARFTARLNNPAIVQVYELGESDGQPYIAMQYIDGGSLADARLDCDDVMRAVRAACKALRHAHQAGIVHRDFKPANVLLDRERRAYLTDFGIARDLRAASGQTLSREGALIGTPALMAPEQARGESHAVDARTDIYAVGASLYWLLCRRYPFQASHLVEMLHAVIHDEPPLPRSINPAIPRAIEAIIVRCMQKDRARRYPAIDELIADLDACLVGRPVAGESAWFRKLVGAPAPPPAATEPDLFERLGMEVAREIAAWDANLYRVSRNITRFHTQLDSLVARLDDILASQPDCAWARFYRGVALFRRGKLDEALDEMERSIDRLSNQAGAQFEMGRLYLALHLREQHRAFKHLSRVGTRFHLADARSRLHQALVAFRESQRLKGQLEDDWQIAFADAVGRLADEDYAGCVAVCDRILERDPDLENVWRLRGDALRFSGGDPIASYRQALRVRRSDHEAYMGLAAAHFDRGDPAAARACLERVLEIYPQHAEAVAQIGRAYLLEARAARQRAADANTIAAILADGLRHAAGAVATAPGSYEALINHAELLIEQARHGGSAASIDAAMERLTRAKSLDGCQNRVVYLRSCAALERARIDRAAGRDPRPDLERILAEAGGDAANVPDNEPWRALRRAAQHELRACEASRAADSCER